MDRISLEQFEVPGGPCGIGDAVYFELDSHAPPVLVTLNRLRGPAIQISLDPGARCYYEAAELRSLTFSARPAFALMPQFLDLRIKLTDLDIGVVEIAAVDARVWAGESLHDIGARLANIAGQRFVSLAPQDWKDLSNIGKAVMSAHDNGVPAKAADIDRLIVSSAVKWEAAALMGWGFLDGEHPPGPGYDRIATAHMMPLANAGVYGYQVVAEVPLQNGAIRREFSSTYFVEASAMGKLTAPAVRVSEVPEAESVLINCVQLGSPTSAGPVTEGVHCTVAYTLITDDVDNEQLFVTPMSSDSQLTGTTFVPVGEMNAASGGAPVVISRMARQIRNDQSFQIPFFDSEVWTGIAVGDHWDRYLICNPTTPLPPKIRYQSMGLPLEKATCNSSVGTADLQLVSNSGWLADRLSRLANGRLEFLGRLPTERCEVTVSVRPGYLHDNRAWAAPYNPTLSPAQQTWLTGGIMTVGAFTARITGFSTDFKGTPLCLFEGDFACAKGPLYEVDPKLGTVKAKLSELEDSDRLWKALTQTDVQANGTLKEYFTTVPLKNVLDPLTQSMTFKFATRMAIDFKNKVYHGPVTAFVSAPYLHSPPPAPDVCAGVQFLGTDYYGRSMLRVEVDLCDWLQPDCGWVAAIAPGHINDKKDFANTLSKGMFGTQPAHREKVLFDAFTAIANASDGDAYTLGVSCVRLGDDAESDPKLLPFLAREAVSKIT